ncbi:MAG: 4Fe-4S cluster-binding domain-containing protein, partial [Gemmataceae bacterium]
MESLEKPDPLLLSIAQTVPFTEAEGPGKRFAIWFQGCPFRCPGCCNPEMLPFRGGVPTPLA